jgi:beta-lactam-binding protein with PASTA domain
MSKQAGLSNSVIRLFLDPRFWLNLALIGVFFIVCALFTFAWLKHYTRHDQKLELPDYTGWNLDEASSDATDENFRISTLDSMYVVGKPGNQILQQHPLPGSMVKENRTIYVTITKSNADQIPVDRLPILYGKNYERKKRELYQSFEIECKIVGRRFDPGEPGHILAVIYKGETISGRKGRKKDVLIEKGTTLDFIISERKGGELAIPDLICKTFAEARFIVENSGLTMGEIITDGNIGIVDSAYVTGQVPDPAEGRMHMGEVVKLSLAATKPIDCN